MTPTDPVAVSSAPGLHPDPQRLSVIIPACNEEAWISRCLGSLIGQDAAVGPLEVIVAANGCTDGTVNLAQGFVGAFAARGWRLLVLNLPAGGKLGALDAADAVAGGTLRAYLDADVRCDPALLGQIRAVLAVEVPRYATGTLAVAPARSSVTRAYARIWTRLPFVTGGAVGAGFFAVNAAGRARWGTWPRIISDDTFARLNFRPSERIEVPALYHWPMVEGLGNLIRVRHRQDSGVAEVRQLFPALAPNESKATPSRALLLRLGLADPLGMLVYLAVHLAVRLHRPASDWTRGR